MWTQTRLSNLRQIVRGMPEPRLRTIGMGALITEYSGLARADPRQISGNPGRNLGSPKRGGLPSNTGNLRGGRLYWGDTDAASRADRVTARRAERLFVKLRNRLERPRSGRPLNVPCP
jgi:hypothetical protein